MWRRYATVFSILEVDLEHLKQLINYINKLNKDIQFTFEYGDKVPYLDVSVSRDPDTNSPLFELYIKPSNLGIFLNYNSHHPKSILINTAKNEYRRAYNNCSNDVLCQKAYTHVSQLLMKNSYPKDVIDKILKSMKNDLQKENREKEHKQKSYLCLPYVDEQCSRKVYSTLRKEDLLKDVRVIFKPGRTLKQSLVATKMLPTKCNKRSLDTCNTCQQDEEGESSMCMKKNLVYELECTICDERYDGETCRHLKDRAREHYRDVSNHSKAMGKHYSSKHPDTVVPRLPFKTKILRSCKDWVDRKIWEAIEIKYRKPSINTQHNKANNSKKEYDVDTWTLL